MWTGKVYEESGQPDQREASWKGYSFEKEDNRMFTPKTILVPIDFSKSSEAALEKALDLAEEYNARVVLLHVDEDVQQCAADYCLSAEDVLEVEEENMMRSRKLLEQEVNSLKGTKHVDIEYDLRTGSPAEVILEEQGRINPDLIVIGTHGRQGFFKHVIGSLADKIVHDAKAPVMVIRA
jgi:nucleotide-binding universal stress UspA family protein